MAHGNDQEHGQLRPLINDRRRSKPSNIWYPLTANGAIAGKPTFANLNDQPSRSKAPEGLDRTTSYKAYYRNGNVIFPATSSASRLHPKG